LLLLLTKQRCRADTLPIPSATKACSSRFKDTTHTLDRRQLTATSACSANSLRRRRCKPTAHCNKSCDHAHVAMLCSCSRDQTLEMGTSFKPTISSTCLLFSNYIQTPIYQFFFEIPTDRTTKFRHVSRRLRKDARRRLTEIRRSAVIKQSASRRRPFEPRTMLFDQVKNWHRRATTGRTSSRESCQVSAGRSIERSQTPTKTPDRRRRRRFYSGRGASNNPASELRASTCKMRPKN